MNDDERKRLQELRQKTDRTPEEDKELRDAETKESDQNKPR